MKRKELVKPTVEAINVGTIGHVFESMHADEVKKLEHVQIGSGAVERRTQLTR